MKIKGKIVKCPPLTNIDWARRQEAVAKRDRFRNILNRREQVAEDERKLREAGHRTEGGEQRLAQGARWIEEDPDHNFVLHEEG